MHIWCACLKKYSKHNTLLGLFCSVHSSSLILLLAWCCTRNNCRYFNLFTIIAKWVNQKYILTSFSNIIDCEGVFYCVHFAGHVPVHPQPWCFPPHLSALGRPSHPYHAHGTARHHGVCWQGAQQPTLAEARPRHVSSAQRIAGHPESSLWVLRVNFWTVNSEPVINYKQYYLASRTVSCKWTHQLSVLYQVFLVNFLMNRAFMCEHILASYMYPGSN